MASSPQKNLQFISPPKEARDFLQNQVKSTSISPFFRNTATLHSILMTSQKGLPGRPLHYRIQAIKIIHRSRPVAKKKTRPAAVCVGAVPMRAARCEISPQPSLAQWQAFTDNESRATNHLSWNRLCTEFIRARHVRAPTMRLCCYRLMT